MSNFLEKCSIDGTHLQKPSAIVVSRGYLNVSHASLPLHSGSRRIDGVRNTYQGTKDYKP